MFPSIVLKLDLRPGLEHADVVLVRGKVRAIPVVADEVAGLRVGRHGEAVADPRASFAM